MPGPDQIIEQKLRDIKNLNQEDLEEIYAQYGTKYQPRGLNALLPHQSKDLIDLIAHARIHMHRDAAQVAKIFGGPLHYIEDELELPHIWEPINYELPFIKLSDITVGKHDKTFHSSEYERLHQLNSKYEAEWMYAAANITYADINIDWSFKYGCSYSSYIDEEHPDWARLFNIHRRQNYLPSIELKVGNKYIVQYRNNKVQRMELVRIVNPDRNFPECYFKDCTWPGKGSTNIGIIKILNEIEKPEKKE